MRCKITITKLICVLATPIIATVALIGLSSLNPLMYNRQYAVSLLEDSMPLSCGTDVDTLPIFIITADSSEDNATYRGTAFLVNEDSWLTAAHVVEDMPTGVKIHTSNGAISGTIEFIDEATDLAVIRTREITEYSPIEISTVDIEDVHNLWSIGFPGWAGNEKIISSGKVLGFAPGMLYTNVTVMSGMSGGPTVICNNNNIEAYGVISAFNQILASEQTVIIDGVAYLEQNFINTGDSFSALISELNHKL